MACQSSLYGYVCCFSITYFTDKDYVRVLSYDRTQTIGEIIARFRINLSLGYALDVIFDGVFDGNNFNISRIYLIYKGIKTSSLTRASRASSDNSASSFFKQIPDCLQRIFSHAELLYFL